MRKIRKGWSVFDEFPPPPRGAPPPARVRRDEESGINAGMELQDIRLLSELADWDDIAIGTAKQFCKGCNFDLFDWRVRNSAFALAANGSFAYLRSSPDWAKKYKPMLMQFFNAQTQKMDA